MGVSPSARAIRRDDDGPRKDVGAVKAVAPVAAAMAPMVKESFMVVLMDLSACEVYVLMTMNCDSGGGGR